MRIANGGPEQTMKGTPIRKWACGDQARQAVLALGVAVMLLSSIALAQQAVEAWVQRYNGPENGDDMAVAMAVDAEGNVIVTGSSLAPAGHPSDYVTIKYSSAGVPVWTNRYGGPGNGNDVAAALAVDASGNVVVTGSSEASDSYPDYATIKYSGAGLPLWTNRYRYNGPEISLNNPCAVAVDASGNVFLTGCSEIIGASQENDYLTIKYSSAGVPLWTNRYNGPANGPDMARAIAVDTKGNVYVTGDSQQIANDIVYSDYLTIAYSEAGLPLWTNSYNGPADCGDMASAIAVHANGIVYVTGSSDSGESGTIDWATIAYSTAGVPLWTNRYGGPGADFATAVAVDADANAVVTGALQSDPSRFRDSVTIKYSSAGVPLWTNRYGPGYGYALAMDGSGNAYLTGASPIGSYEDYATLAYSSAGVPLWTNLYNGPANRGDSPQALAADSKGNVYVTGNSTGTNGNLDFATIKYVIPPIIIRQPLSCTNPVGTTASFSVEAIGGTPLGYQWRRDETNLVEGDRVSGVTTADLSIANVQLEDACDYTVVVTNEWGSATSVAAHLTVTIPPSAGRFTNLAYSPTAGFSFVFRDGTLGRSYRIQRSSSLAEGTWADWQSFTYSEPLALTDLGATRVERRFYRAITP